MLNSINSSNSNEMVSYRKEYVDNLIYENRRLKEKLEEIERISSINDITNEVMDKNYKWYKDHCIELYNRYTKRYLLIHDCNVVGEYDNYLNAVNEGKNTYGFNNFIVQENLNEIVPLSIDSNMDKEEVKVYVDNTLDKIV